MGAMSLAVRAASSWFSSRSYVWAIDFQFDQTIDGRALEFLNVLDEYSRFCFAIRVGR
jgi:putative transposase